MVGYAGDSLEIKEGTENELSYELGKMGIEKPEESSFSGVVKSKLNQNGLCDG